MKGYQLDNKLYVFPQTPDTIPFVDSDVTVIYVQEENLPAWKEKNSTVADMIVKYNYNIMTVKPKEWAGHTDDDIYIPVTPELAWSAASATATIGETNTYPTLTNPHSVTVTYASSNISAASINENTGAITLVEEGTTTISASFAGDDDYAAQTVTYTLSVESSVPHDYSQDYFTIKALVPNLELEYNPNSDVTGIYYSTDNGTTWDEFDDKITLTNTYDKVLLKHTGTIDKDAGELIFHASGDYAVEGNVMSLLFGDSFADKYDMTGYSLHMLFGVVNTPYFETKLISAENLVLPATTLSNRCYFGMFGTCFNLVAAPKELPATTLAQGCYRAMFANCHSLITVPELPAETLVEECYYGMFGHCYSLNYIKCMATDISATNCTYHFTEDVAATGTFVKASTMNSWTTGADGIPTGWTVESQAVSPELAWSANSATATIGDTNTYPTLTNPNSVTVSYTSSDTSAATIDQTTGVITLVAAGTTTISAVFEGNTTYLAQTVTYTLTVEAAPSHDYEHDYFTIRAEEPNVTVATNPDNTGVSNVYYSTDGGDNWSVLNSTITLTNEGDTILLKHSGKFGGYTGNTAKLFAVSGEYSVEGNIMSLLLYDGFYGVYTLTSYTNALKSTFKNDTNLISAEHLILPATTLEQGCYSAMFLGCTSLVTAPELPATTLAASCYQNMFGGCISLNYIKCLATDISASVCTANWVDGVAASGTFVKDASMSSWTTGMSGIPSDWTVEDAPI